jgi:predicted glycoside hydrolase/deacetylase ChbG (UPF0249 family)
MGVHLNLTQGRPLSGGKYPAELLDCSGRFPGIGGLARNLLLGGWKYRDFIGQELKAQIEVVLDHGIRPTHLNSHQYADILPVVASLVPGLMRRYGISVVRVPLERGLWQSTLIQRFEPLNWCLGQVKQFYAFLQRRQINRRGFAYPTGFFGTSHAARIDAAVMQGYVAAAKAGLTEVGMHPGAPARGADDAREADGWHDPLAAQRPAELALLTSGDLAALFERRGIQLSRLTELSCREPARTAA